MDADSNSTMDDMTNIVRFCRKTLVPLVKDARKAWTGPSETNRFLFLNARPLADNFAIQYEYHGRKKGKDLLQYVKPRLDRTKFKQANLWYHIHRQEGAPVKFPKSAFKELSVHEICGYAEGSDPIVIELVVEQGRDEQGSESSEDGWEGDDFSCGEEMHAFDCDDKEASCDVDTMVWYTIIVCIASCALALTSR